MLEMSQNILMDRVVVGYKIPAIENLGVTRVCTFNHLASNNILPCFIGPT